MATRLGSLLQIRWIGWIDEWRLALARTRAVGRWWEIALRGPVGAVANQLQRSKHAPLAQPSRSYILRPDSFSFLVVHRRLCGNASLLARICCPKIATFYMNVSEPISRCCSALLALLAWLTDLAVSSCFSTNRLVLFPAAHDFNWCFQVDSLRKYCCDEDFLLRLRALSQN